MAAITTTGSGNWSSVTPNAPWPVGTIPVEGDTVIIASGHTVTIDQNVTIGADSATAAIAVTGILTFDTAASRTLTCKGDFTINAAGTLEVGTSGVRVPATTIITIKLNYSATMAAGKYFFKATASTAKILCYGASKTRATTLNGGISIGATSVTVADTTGWQVNDYIVIASTDANANNKAEYRQITAIAGDTVTVAGVTFAHANTARVANVTSNVVFTAYNTSFAFNAQIGITTAANHVLDQVEVSYAGGGTDGGNNNAWCLYTSTTTATYTDSSFHHGAGGLRLYNATGCTVTRCVFSLASIGAYIYSSASNNIFDNCYFIQASGSGVISSYSSGGISNTFNSCEFIGNSNGFTAQSSANNTFNSCLFEGNNYGFNNASGVNAGNTFNSCVFGVGVTGVQYNGADIKVSISYDTAVLDNCTLNSPTQVNGAANLMTGSSISLSSIGGVSTDNTTYYAYAIVSQATDQLYSGTTYSLKVQPQNAAKPQSFTLNVVANANQPVAVTGYMYIDSNYGASNLPSLSITGAGITTNTWTATNTPSTWQQFTVSGTPTQNGLCTLTFTVQAASTANVWIGNVAVAGVAVNTGTFGYWYEGKPVELLLSTGLGAFDIWNVPTSTLTATGSTGKQIKDVLTIGKFLGLK